MDWGAVQQYLEQLVPARPAAIAGMEEAAATSGFPIVGPASGQFCYLVARMIGARSVFELGSGFGYSTAWFARAVRENGGGVVHHVVWDQALSMQARSYMDELGLADTVRFTVGEAIAALDAADGTFDLIFNDIDKEAYPRSLEVINRKLRPGGVLIVDNLLWSGRALDETDDTPATRGVRELTRLVFGDSSWIASIVPIRDGLLLAMKAGKPG